MRNVEDVTTLAPAFWRTRPDAPKWSMCECVTTTVCTFFSWKPASWNRSISSFHACGPGMPGVDDGEALLVFEGVAVHVAEAWHPQR